jgi:hypothetical protein
VIVTEQLQDDGSLTAPPIAGHADSFSQRGVASEQTFVLFLSAMERDASWQGRADYDGQRNASRSCCDCRRDYTHEEMRREMGWEPLLGGWRCGACGRLRRQEVRAAAMRLIETTEPRWILGPRLAAPQRPG